MSDQNKIDPELIHDVFNIPRDGKNISDDDDEDLGLAGGPANVSFDVKAKEVADAIAGAKVVPAESNSGQKNGENTKDSAAESPKSVIDKALRESVPVTAPKVASPVSEKKPPTAAPSHVSNLFDDDAGPSATFSSEQKTVAPTPLKVETPKAEAKPVVEAPKAVETPKPVAPKQAPKGVSLPSYAPFIPDEEDEELANDDTKSADRSGPCDPWEEGEQWLLDSPAPKYDRLYREKKIALTDGPNGILKGGQLNFDKLFDELAELNVDVTVKTYDPQDIHEKMQLVQKLRGRLEEIRLKVSRQYHHWERYIELFHGVLCRTEYERGKQEGLNYDHLRDMEHYFCSVKALHKASEQIMRTLDGAFECLSRQVTVVMPMKEIERYGAAPNSQPISSPKPMTPALKKFDGLNGGKPGPKDEPGGSSPSGWAM
jgi:hypothetical protein